MEVKKIRQMSARLCLLASAVKQRCPVPTAAEGSQIDKQHLYLSKSKQKFRRRECQRYDVDSVLKYFQIYELKDSAMYR